MTAESSFNQYANEVSKEIGARLNNGRLEYKNSNGKVFEIPEDELLSVLHIIHRSNSEIEKALRAANPGASSPWNYEEKAFRNVLPKFIPTDKAPKFVTQLGSQTKPLLSAMAKYVGFGTGKRAVEIRPLPFDQETLDAFFAHTESVPDSGSLEDAFDKICAFCKWHADNGSVGVTNPATASLKTGLEVFERWMSTQFSEFRGTSLSVKVGIGLGRVARVPYICLLPPGQEVSDGVYVVVCFGASGEGAVAGFAQSVANPRPGFIAVDRRSQQMLVNVDGATPATKYNNAFSNPLEILRGNFDEAVFAQHIRESLELCIQYLKPASTEITSALSAEEVSLFAPAIAESFRAALQDCGFKCNETLPLTLICSLIAKPFVILTGNSGTGKTKIAQLLADWLSSSDYEGSYELVPVGADWTDNRKVLGYVNLLRRADVNGSQANVYQSTRVLELVLRARANKDVPHFLILDEMNLSHVERYFADFLSAMESKDSIPLHDEAGFVITSAGTVLENPSLTIPPNLFVVGTVNVDETTYMFSPKVLDRANVIEFNAGSTEVVSLIDDHNSGLRDITPAQPLTARLFQKLASSLSESGNSDLFPELKSVALGDARRATERLFEILKKSRLEFGFRTALEMRRYLLIRAYFSGSNFDEQVALDSQFLQRILPRLHGSRRKMEPLLQDLERFFFSGGNGTEDGNIPTDSSDGPVYPDSHRRIVEMLETVRRDQFVSFIQ